MGVLVRASAALKQPERACKGRGTTVSAAGATSFCPRPTWILAGIWAQAMWLGALGLPLAAAEWAFVPLLSAEETEHLLALAAPHLAPAFEQQRLLASVGSSPLVSPAEARRWRREPHKALEEVRRRPEKLTRYSDQVRASGIARWGFQGCVALEQAPAPTAAPACQLPAAALGWGEGATGPGALAGAALWSAWPLRAALGLGLAGAPRSVFPLPPAGAGVGRGDLPTATGRRQIAWGFNLKCLEPCLEAKLVELHVAGLAPRLLAALRPASHPAGRPVLPGAPRLGLGLEQPLAPRRLPRGGWRPRGLSRAEGLQVGRQRLAQQALPRRPRVSRVKRPAQA